MIQLSFDYNFKRFIQIQLALLLQIICVFGKVFSKDFAKYANDLKDQGKLDLDKPFEVVIEAELDQNGKLENPRFTKKAGDPNLVDVFARMVAALNDSGYLIY